jgi:predicted nucleic acid-binding protein
MIYLDANVLIRLIEGLPAVRAPIETKLLQSRCAAPFLQTSRLSRLECRTMPCLPMPKCKCLRLTPSVVEKATDLRATLNMFTPDAIHLATAILGKASVFLTGDQGLLRCKDVKVEIL